MTNPESRTPVQLAEEIVKIVGDFDDNTAHIALQIARLLLEHRQLAELEFRRLCLEEER